MFDKDGWIIAQKVKSKIVHEDDHDRFLVDIEPIIEYDISEYFSHTQTTKDKINGVLKVVPLSETKYKGKKFEKWNKIGSGALALIGKSANNDKMIVFKVLIPKKTKNG